MKKSEHKGQVALILVLIMTLVSALAVSLASRSTIDTRIQQTESESVQALLFAQTGLEQLIMNPALLSTSDPNYYAVTSDLGTDSLEVGLVEKGGSVELNLEGANFVSLTGFAVNWGPDDGTLGGQPAVFISIVESNGKITDRAFDYQGLNGFTTAFNVAGNYPKTTNKISLVSSAVKVRITALGSPAKIKIIPLDAGAVFPPQIKSIKSTGTVTSNNNSVKYGLQYDESTVDSVPSVFDYALFSGGSIIQ